MRRIPALALACCMALTSCAAPAKRIEPWGTPEEAARAARDILLEARKADQRITTDCLDIRSTRVFTIAEHPEALRYDGSPEPKASMFDGMAYVVEFILLTDEYGSSPYSFFSGTNDHVILYRNGDSSVRMSPFRQYSNMVYNWDYTGIITEVTDLGTRFNGVWHLKEK